MNTAALLIALGTIAFVLSAVDCGDAYGKYRKRGQKVKACLEGSDDEAKSGRMKEAVKACKEAQTAKEEMKKCIDEKLGLSEGEKKCVDAIDA
ncbi:hypothetical protein V5799_012397 [Amblyomma americanum]|uniref:Secreted protein n=1 Tax=Amblyomma americanum TaxID=6943 RepID=A0AAQ4EEG7_AMBAM